MNPDEPLKINILERDDLADIVAALNLKVPDWAIGALVWLLVSELYLKRVYPTKFQDLQTGLIGADLVTELPDGVAIVAYLYKTLHLIEVKEDIVIDIVGFLNRIVRGIAKATGI